MSAASFAEALQALLSGTELPAWRAESIPAGAPLPCLTYAAEVAPYGQAGRLRLHAWTREGPPSLHAMLGTLLRMIHQEGMILRYSGGSALIWPDCWRYRQDAADPGLWCVEVLATLRVYSLEGV